MKFQTTNFVIVVYTWEREKRHRACEVYDGYQDYVHKLQHGMQTHCLFYKSHEPWWKSAKTVCEGTSRGVLLLRHPYDAAFSEYKRWVTVKHFTLEIMLASIKIFTNFQHNMSF